LPAMSEISNKWVSSLRMASDVPIPAPGTQQNGV
jgi:hypothetical protein